MLDIGAECDRFADLHCKEQGLRRNSKAYKKMFAEQRERIASYITTRAIARANAQIEQLINEHAKTTSDRYYQSDLRQAALYHEKSLDLSALGAPAATVERAIAISAAYEQRCREVDKAFESAVKLLVDYISSLRQSNPEF